MKLNRIALAAASLGAVMWLGSDSSYHLVLQAQEQVALLEAQGAAAIQAKVLEVRSSMKLGSADDPFALPPMYRVQDGVGILEISGPLITGSAGWMRLFGVVGYDDIRAAASELVSLKSVKSILMHVSSPGGAAAGCEDCSAHLRAVGQIKPVTAFTDTVMASGGYWLGSAGKTILAASTAMLGSVGVLITFVDQTKADAMAGLNYEIIRIGEFKQLANPHEKLSDEAKAHLTAMGEEMYSVFRDNVAENLGVTPQAFDKTMGRGREFMGAQAVKAGLANQLATFDQAVAYAKSVDSSKLNSQNSRNSQKDPAMKATLAASILLQLAGGALPASLDLTKAESTMAGEVPDAEAQTLLRAQAIEVSAALQTGQAAAIKAATDPITTELNALKATHATVNTELGGLRTTNGSLVTQVQTLEAQVASTEKILHNSLGAMCVALQAGAPKAELKGAELLAEHDRVEKLYVAKFPGTRVSAAAPAEKKTDTPAGEVPSFLRVAQRATAARNAA